MGAAAAAQEAAEGGGGGGGGRSVIRAIGYEEVPSLSEDGGVAVRAKVLEEAVV